MYPVQRVPASLKKDVKVEDETAEKTVNVVDLKGGDVNINSQCLARTWNSTRQMISQMMDLELPILKIWSRGRPNT